MSACSHEQCFRRGILERLPLAAIVGLSLFDLAVTLFFMRTIGLFESNPIARWLAGSPHPVLAIAFFKLASVALCTTLLAGLRRHRTARIAAWALAAVLLAVGVRWVQYGAATFETDWRFHQSTKTGSDNWVRLSQ